VVSKKILSHLNSGHDVSTAEEIHAAILSSGGIRNVSPSVIAISSKEGSMKKISLVGISNFHSANFEDSQGIRFWKYHGIGNGLQSQIKIEDVKQDLKYTIIKPFCEEFPVGRAAHKHNGTNRSKVEVCPVLHCLSTFSCVEDLISHTKDNVHTPYEQSRSSQDEVKMYYVEKIKMGLCRIRDLKKTTDNNSQEADVSNDSFKMGFALKTRKPSVHLNLKQKKFVYQEFLEGEKTGKKISAEKFVLKMRNVVSKTGKKLFLPHEFLTKQQTMSQFSKLAAQRKNNKIEEYLSSAQTINVTDEDQEEFDLRKQIEKNFELDFLNTVKNDINKNFQN
jgi:hypothetical protein